MSIQPGNLIKSTQARFGCPKGTVGFVTECHSALDAVGEPIVVYVVKFHGIDNTRRIIEVDMEVLSEATL